MVKTLGLMIMEINIIKKELRKEIDYKDVKESMDSGEFYTAQNLEAYMTMYKQLMSLYTLDEYKIEDPKTGKNNFRKKMILKINMDILIKIKDI